MLQRLRPAADGGRERRPHPARRAPGQPRRRPDRGGAHRPWPDRRLLLPGTAGAEDVGTVERAATVAALAVTKQLAVRAVESKYQGDFLRDLLTGQVGPEVGVAHAASLGWDVDRPLVVVVAELDPDEGEEQTATLVARPAGERFTAAWQSVVRPRDPQAPVAGFHREVVAVLGAPAHRDVDRFVRDLVREVRGDGGGGRRPFGTRGSRGGPPPGGVPRAGRQARAAGGGGGPGPGARALAPFHGPRGVP